MGKDHLLGKRTRGAISVLFTCPDSILVQKVGGITICQTGRVNVPISKLRTDLIKPTSVILFEIRMDTKN